MADLNITTIADTSLFTGDVNNALGIRAGLSFVDSYKWFAMFGDAVHSRVGNEIPTIRQIGHLRLVHWVD